MSHRERFKTLGRHTHRHGRLSVLFDFDVHTQILFVHVLSARDLPLFSKPSPLSVKRATSGMDKLDVDRRKVQCRVQLLPLEDITLIDKVSYL